MRNTPVMRNQISEKEEGGGHGSTDAERDQIYFDYKLKSMELRPLGRRGLITKMSRDE